MKKIFNIFLALSLMVAVVPAQAMQDTITAATDAARDAGSTTVDALEQVGEGVRHTAEATAQAYGRNEPVGQRVVNFVRPFAVLGAIVAIPVVLDKATEWAFGSEVAQAASIARIIVAICLFMP